MNAPQENLSHAQAQQWIDQALDKALDSRQQAQLDRHLAGCSQCAAYRGISRDLHDQLRRALPARWPEPAYPPAALNRKLTRLHTRTRRTAMRNTLISLARLTVGAALLIGLIFGLASLVQSLNLQPATPGGDLTATATTPIPATPTLLPGMLTLAEAEVRVEQWLQDSYASETPVDLPLNELTSDEIWQRLEAQVFRVTDGNFVGETYLLHAGKVTRILTTPDLMGGLDLFVTDLDGNSRLELLLIDQFGVQQPLAWLLEQDGEGFVTKAYSYFTNVSLKKISDDVLETYRVDGPGYQLTGRLAVADDRLVLAPLDESIRLNIVADWDLSFQIPADWHTASTADGAVRLEGEDGYLELPSSLVSGDLRRTCELALNTNPGGIFGGKSSASMTEAASRTICFINQSLSNPQENNEAWVYLPVGESNQYARIVIDHLHLGLLVSTLTYHSAAGLSRGPDDPVTLSIEPNAPAPVLETRSLDDLTLEEWQVVSANVDSPVHFEFNQRIPAGVKDRRAAWRETTLADRIAANNLLLTPFGYHLEDHSPASGPNNITLFKGAHPLLERLELVYPASVYRDERGGGDFALVVVDAQDQSHLVRSSGVSSYDLAVSHFTLPVFAGGRLISLDSYYGEDERLHLSVKQDGTEIFEYRPLSGPSDPVKGLWGWDGHWVLEIDGVLIVNGAIWNEKEFPADEIFNWHILNGKPMFFFTRAGQTGMWYDGREQPLVYQDVVHYRCCEPYIFNPGGNDQMLWFYAKRDGYWYYVELGSYH